MSHIVRRRFVRNPGHSKYKGRQWRNPALFGTGYAVLNSVSGSRVSTPDHADFAISAQLDVRALMFNADWADGSLRRIVGQRTGAANRSWSFYIDGSGELGFNWSELGTGDAGDGGFEESTANLSTQPDQSWLWLRATFLGNNGSGSYEIKFYTSTDPPTTSPGSVNWVQLGSTKSQATIEALFNSTADVVIGAIDDGSHWIGRAGYVEIRNSINGTIVANPDFRWRTDYTSPTSVTDSTGKVWSINSPAYWVLPLMTEEPPDFQLGRVATLTMVRGDADFQVGRVAVMTAIRGDADFQLGRVAILTMITPPPPFRFPYPPRRMQVVRFRK